LSKTVDAINSLSRNI